MCVAICQAASIGPRVFATTVPRSLRDLFTTSYIVRAVIEGNSACLVCFFWPAGPPARYIPTVNFNEWCANVIFILTRYATVNVIIREGIQSLLEPQPSRKRSLFVFEIHLRIKLMDESFRARNHLFWRRLKTDLNV